MYLEGAGLEQLIPELWPLAVIAAVMLTTAALMLPSATDLAVRCPRARSASKGEHWQSQWHTWPLRLRASFTSSALRARSAMQAFTRSDNILRTVAASVIRLPSKCIAASPRNTGAASDSTIVCPIVMAVELHEHLGDQFAAEIDAPVQ